MSAFAGSGRSPSAWTVTGLSSMRTPHSGAVATWAWPVSDTSPRAPVRGAPAPCGRGGAVVVAVLRHEPEDLVDGAADHVRVAEAGQFAGAAPGPDQAALL